MAKHYTIPFFIPHKGCPHRCIFCDQNRITSRPSAKSEEVGEKIARYLSTMPKEEAAIEVGFFGGSFTALDRHIQEAFLDSVRPFLDKGAIHGIRLSTRPDYIDEDRLKFLKKKRVSCIELGVQSMSDKVLSYAKRGHTSEDTTRSSRMIVSEGFTLGHQMMLGLPFSSAKDEYFTACSSRELGAEEVRIYPLLVIRGTELAELWRGNNYKPLSEGEALRRSANLIMYFEANDIKVIRCGLHPSEGLISKNELLDGPFHEAFRLKAESRIFSFMLKFIADNFHDNTVEICFNPADEAAFFGFKQENLPLMSAGYNRKKNENVPKGTLLVSGNNRILTLTRKMLADSILPEEFFSGGRTFDYSR